MREVLRADDLTVRFRTKEGHVKAVIGVSFALREESIMCLVGESGAGKSTTALALLGLLPKSAEVVSGNVYFDGLDLLSVDKRTMRQIRGKDISMVPQEPRSALNPILTIGSQVEELILAHTDMSRREAVSLATDMLREIGNARPQGDSKEVPVSTQRWNVPAGDALHGPGAAA